MLHSLIIDWDFFVNVRGVYGYKIIIAIIMICPTQNYGHILQGECGSENISHSQPKYNIFVFVPFLTENCVPGDDGLIGI